MSNIAGRFLLIVLPFFKNFLLLYIFYILKGKTCAKYDRSIYTFFAIIYFSFFFFIISSRTLHKSVILLYISCIYSCEPLFIINFFI